MSIRSIRKNALDGLRNRGHAGEILASDVSLKSGLKNAAYLFGMGVIGGTAGCKKEPPAGPVMRAVEVANAYPTAEWTRLNGGQDYFLVVEYDAGNGDVDAYKCRGTKKAVENAALRLQRGDRVTFVEQDGECSLDTMSIDAYPLGEIPFGRDLVVKRYEIDKMRDFNDPSQVNRPIATLVVEFGEGNVQQEYVINIFGQTEREAERTVRHLQQYGVLRINEQKAGRRGSRGPKVTIEPTERGPELNVPAYRLNWSDLYPYTVTVPDPRREGSITPSGVDEPWKNKKPKPRRPAKASGKKPSKGLITDPVKELAVEAFRRSRDNSILLEDSVMPPIRELQNDSLLDTVRKLKKHKKKHN